MAKKERKEKKEKPLDKMTATELRKYALDTGEISGVHGMNKEELLTAIKEAKGIKDEGKHTEKVSMRDLKEKAVAVGQETGSHCRQRTPGEDRTSHPQDTVGGLSHAEDVVIRQVAVFLGEGVAIKGQGSKGGAGCAC
jgi:hypothetical protein